MSKIIIKNNIWGRYDYITLCIDDEIYYLKPESEISVEVYNNKIPIEFSIYFSKRKKFLLEIEEGNEIYLKLNFNKYFVIYCLLNIIIFLLFAVIILLTYIYSNLEIIRFFFFPLYVIFFAYWWFFKGTIFIDLIENDNRTRNYTVYRISRKP